MRYLMKHPLVPETDSRRALQQRRVRSTVRKRISKVWLMFGVHENMHPVISISLRECSGDGAQYVPESKEEPVKP